MILFSIVKHDWQISRTIALYLYEQEAGFSCKTMRVIYRSEQMVHVISLDVCTGGVSGWHVHSDADLGLVCPEAVSAATPRGS